MHAEIVIGVVSNKKMLPEDENQHYPFMQMQLARASDAHRFALVYLMNSESAILPTATDDDQESTYATAQMRCTPKIV